MDNRGDCSERVLRGGSWDFRPRRLRSAGRGGITTGDRYNDIGFRVARTLHLESLPLYPGVQGAQPLENFA